MKSQALLCVLTLVAISLQVQTFTNSATLSATMDDGIHTSYAANKTDYDRVFVAYPNMPVPHGKGLSALDTEIAPGQTVDGTLFFYPFKVSKQEWDARKNLNFTFAFRYQPNVAVAPQVTITEQGNN